MSLLTPDFGLLFWMLVSFGIVVFLLVKFGFPVIVKMVEDRKAYIDESLLAAQQAREQLTKVKEESDAIIAQARKEQVDILAEAAKTRDMMIEDAKDKAKNEGVKQIELAKKQIELEKDDAIRSVRREVAKLSVDIAEKVLRAKLDNDKDQMNMIDRLLDEINISKS